MDSVKRGTKNMAAKKVAKKAKRGQFAGGNLVGTVLVVVSVVLALIIGAVMLGQLATINTNSLGANVNATGQINLGFDLLETTQGIKTAAY